jgi:O-antigen ligase
MTAMALSKRAVFAGEAILLAWLLGTEDLRVFGLAALGMLAVVVMAAITSISWPLGALLVLTAASAMPRLAATVIGLHLRPEHVAIGFVALALAGQALKHRKFPTLHLRNFDYFLLAFVGMNFFTSAVTSPQPHLTLRWAAMNAIAIGPYFLVGWMVTDESKLHRAFHFLLWVGAVESAFGVLCFLSNRLFQTTVGVEAAQYGAISGIYGTQYEANLFGSYSACCAIMFLTCFMLGEKSRRAGYGLGFAITICGAFISLARSVLLALPVAALFVIWAALRRRQFQMRRLLPLAVGFAVVLLAISPLVLGLVRERFSTIDVAELGSDPTSLVRIVQMAVAAEDVQAHPILGTGTASFQLFFDWDDYMPGMQDESDVAGWVGNTPLRILHDTGIVGLGIFLVFLGVLARAVRKAVRKADYHTRTVLIALSAGLLLYAITFQATEATILAFTWVHLGMLAAAVRLVSLPYSATEAIPSVSGPVAT